MLQTNEFLLNNSLEKYLQDMFKPFFVMQNVLLVNKFSLKYNFITPNSKSSWLKSSLAILIIILLFVTTTYTTSFGSGDIGKIQTFAYTQHVFFLIFIIISNVLHSKSNVNLFLKLQQIFIKMNPKLQNCAIFYEKLNWFLITVLLTMNICMCAFKLIFDPFWNWAKFCLITSTFIIDLEILFAIGIINFITSCVNVWREHFNFVASVVESQIIGDGKPSSNIQVMVNESLDIFKNILKAFSLSKIVLRLPVSISNFNNTR